MEYKGNHQQQLLAFDSFGAGSSLIMILLRPLPPADDLVPIPAEEEDPDPDAAFC